jgi:hypothetical protein
MAKYSEVSAEEKLRAVESWLSGKMGPSEAGRRIGSSF